MPLIPGSSKKVISENIAEFHHGNTYQRTMAKFGKKKADAQAVAASFSNARKGKKKLNLKRKAM
jgi:aminoglycoside phosphotransferase family enzyme